MPTISGPTIQIPTTIGDIVDERGIIKQEWQSFFGAIGRTTFNGSRSGPTLSRPTEAMQGRWIGMPYFDSTLGFEINLASVNPDVWVRYDGTPV